MTHGAPDDSDVVRDDTLHVLTDLAELSSRLGGLLRFYRSGSLVWYEDWTGGVGAAYLATSGTLSNARLTGDRSSRGGVSLRLQVGSGVGDYAYVRMRMAPVAVSYVSLSGIIWTDAKLDHLLMSMLVYDGSVRVEYKVRLKFVSNALEYQDSLSRFSEFAGAIPLLRNDRTPFPFKLVADLVASQYGAFYLSNTEYSLAGINAYSITDSTLPQVAIIIQAFTDGVNVSNTYVDELALVEHDE